MFRPVVQPLVPSMLGLRQRSLDRRRIARQLVGRHDLLTEGDVVAARVTYSAGIEGPCRGRGRSADCRPPAGQSSPVPPELRSAPFDATGAALPSASSVRIARTRDGGVVI